MKITKICLLLLILVLILAYGCQINCPSGDTDLAGWVPYNIGDKVIYISNHGDTVSFIFADKQISKDYKAAKQDCSEWALLTSQNYNFRIDKYKSRINIIFNFGIDSAGCSFALDDVQNIMKPLNFNGKTYNEAMILEKDTINNPVTTIWKVIFAKDYGMIAFYDRVRKCVWTLSQ